MRLFPRALALAAVASCADPEGSASPPHVILIVADDLGCGDVGFHGGAPRTPHLDALARDSQVPRRFYAYALCTPSRAALLTGRDPGRCGLLHHPLRPWDDAGLPPEEPTLAEYLGERGYQTALVGKWHLGHAEPRFQPRRRGFQHFYGFLNGAVDYWTHRSRDGAHDWQRNGESAPEQGYATELLAGEAVRVIRERDPQRPLFLLVAFNAPHAPLQAPPELAGDYAAVADPARRTLCAMVESLDQAAGRILAALREEGLYEQSFIAFLSDNGASLEDGGSNGELRGGKGSAFEGGLRVPALIKWPPGRAPAAGLGVASVLDLAPTICELAGVQARPDRAFDGLVLGSGAARDLYFAAASEDYYNAAVIRGPWKLIRRGRSDGSVERTLLFHLEEDPAEQDNRAAAEPEMVAEMAAALDAWSAAGPGRAGPPPAAAPPPGWSAPADWAER